MFVTVDSLTLIITCTHIFFMFFKNKVEKSSSFPCVPFTCVMSKSSSFPCVPFTCVMSSVNAADLDLEINERRRSRCDSDLPTQIDGVVGVVDVATPVEIVTRHVETELVLACQQ